MVENEGGEEYCGIDQVTPKNYTKLMVNRVVDFLKTSILILRILFQDYNFTDWFV